MAGRVFMTSLISTSLRSDCQLFQVLHENLQRDIIGEDWSATITAVVKHIVVSLRWIHLGQEEPRLRAARFCDDVARHREPGLKDLLSIVNRSLEQLREILVFGLVLVIEFFPSCDGFTVIDDDVEKGVHQKNSVILQRGRVQQNGFRWSVEGVRVENRLNHDQRLSQIFFRQAVPVVGSFVRTVVEDLQKL